MFSAIRDVGTYRSGASDMSTHRRIFPQRTDISQSQPPPYPRGCIFRDVGFHPFNESPQSPHRCVSPRCRMFPAMRDVGTYRQVRPTCQPTGGCIQKERMRRNHNRPSPRAGAFSAMHDVGTYRPGASVVSISRRMRPQRTNITE